MARPKGSTNKVNAEIKNALHNVFSIVNKDNAFLLDLAKNDKPLFCGLISKIIPNEVAIDMNIAVIDLAGAMFASQQQLQTLQANNELKTIEHVTRDTLSPNSETPNKAITAKSLKTKENKG